MTPLQVLYYLFRVEPFTTLSIQLQGGKFDHADRMFSDLSGTWDSVLEDMSDVKELVSLRTSVCCSFYTYYWFVSKSSQDLCCNLISVDIYLGA
jgi:hypothetical protein